MKEIEVIKNTSILDFCKQNRDTAHLLIKNSVSNRGLLTVLAKILILPIVDLISRKWLEKTNNPYYAEIKAYQESIKCSGVYAINLSYEWGCSSSAFNHVSGPTLFRVLDWPLSGLGENVYVLEQSTKHGNFYNVTWPGLAGVYQAIAPGRFAVSINQAPMRMHGSRVSLSWLKNRLLHWRQNALPPAHLLRYVFENAKNFAEAKQMLAETPISMPVFFTLSGVHKNEGCVIERLENHVIIRDIDNTDQVSITNHFQTDLQQHACAWKSRALDSNGRAEQVNHIHKKWQGKTDLNFLEYPVANHLTRLVMLANAATGEITVQGWESSGPATKVLHTIIQPEV